MFQVRFRIWCPRLLPGGGGERLGCLPFLFPLLLSFELCLFDFSRFLKRSTKLEGTHPHTHTHKQAMRCSSQYICQPNQYQCKVGLELLAAKLWSSKQQMLGDWMTMVCCKAAGLWWVLVVTFYLLVTSSLHTNTAMWLQHYSLFTPFGLSLVGLRFLLFWQLIRNRSKQAFHLGRCIFPTFFFAHQQISIIWNRKTFTHAHSHTYTHSQYKGDTIHIIFFLLSLSLSISHNAKMHLTKAEQKKYLH